MPRPDLSKVPQALQAPLAACARGEMAPNVALMHLCMAAPDAAAVSHAVDASGLAQMGALWRANPRSFDLVKAILAADRPQQGGFSAEAKLAACASAFDIAAALSPEAGVALYSLGDPNLLAAATDEIVEAMTQWSLLGREKVALEIGCGNGRFLEALAPRLRRITGIDISPVMIAAAQQRCHHLDNVDVRQTDGRDLALFADASLDLVLAVDSFPYVVRCGKDLLSRHFTEAARVLRPCGHMLILNYSYRGDLERDRVEVTEHADRTGLVLRRHDRHDFRLWDGVTFLLGKDTHG
jgi:SAM-dependent methyltransferase